VWGISQNELVPDLGIVICPDEAMSPIWFMKKVG
jgi:hypothetical protein